MAAHLNMTEEELENFDPNNWFHNHQQESEFFYNTGQVQETGCAGCETLKSELDHLWAENSPLHERLANQDILLRDALAALQASQEA